MSLKYAFVLAEGIAGKHGGLPVREHNEHLARQRRYHHFMECSALSFEAQIGCGCRQADDDVNVASGFKNGTFASAFWHARGLLRNIFCACVWFFLLCSSKAYLET